MDVHDLNDDSSKSLYLRVEIKHVKSMKTYRGPVD
ncbi:hypothetical protein V6Z12_D01G193200 [Gossypium hirsutum]